MFDSDPIAHVQTIRSHFERLRKHNPKISPSKDRSGAIDENFPGRSISPVGLPPNVEKVSALVNMPMPTDVKQARALMGGINYYRNFSPDLSKRLHPINSLLCKGIPFCSRPLWKKWYEKSSLSLRFRRFWVSLIGTLSPTAHVRFTCTVTLASTGLVPPSNRGRRTVP